MKLRKRALDLDIRDLDISTYINDMINPKPGDKHSEYVANIKLDSMKMEGSFTIFLFAGDFDEDKPSGWFEERNLIGSHGFFSSPTSMGDGTALVNAGATITDSLILNHAAGLLDGLTQGAVTKYLKDKIEWRIVKADGTVLDEDDVPGLEVAIMAAEVEVPGLNYQMPCWGAFKPLEEITAGKKHGFGGVIGASASASAGVSIGI